MNRMFHETGWPSQSEIEAFRSNGFIAGPRLLDAEIIRRTRHHTELLASGIYDKGMTPARSHAVDPQLRKWKNSWWADSALEEIATSRVIGKAAASLLGVAEIFLWEDHLIWKGPADIPQTQHDGSGRVGWHQDKHYWQSATGSEMLTAVVAIDDCTEETGCLHFVSGSHEWGLMEAGDFYNQNHQQQTDALAIASTGREWDEVPVVLPAGFLSFHHCLTLHTSAPNRSRHDRRLLCIHLMSGNTTLARGKGHLNERLTDAPEGLPFRGHSFPRLWPPPDRRSTESESLL